jgi:hypothetical protein
MPPVVPADACPSAFFFFFSAFFLSRNGSRFFFDRFRKEENRRIPAISRNPVGAPGLGL